MSPSEETSGRPVAPADKASSSLPFGQQVALSSISGPTYVTAQLLVQQVAYLLSDKIFSYSAPTFDLDLAVRAWAEAKERNIRGEQTDVVQLQTRTGAGALALGYMFSPDFDMAKRHVPQTLLAPSLSLNNLRSSLDQLSLLYGVASPFVAHVAALDYDARDGLLSEYDTALRTAEELGLGLVASASAAETQHMALFATLMAAVLPTIHIYDGVRLARETSRVVDALSKAGVADLFNKLTTGSPAAEERHAISSKVVNLLSLVNRELGDGSDNEANHTALLATLMTALTPSLGVDEGVRLAKETIKASDALSRRGVAETYKKISTEVATLNKRLDDPGKVVELLKLFNNELGTAYDLFEYHGHADAETVLVVFGSVEAQLAKQVAARLDADGHRVGAVNVRVYRPFVEEAFLKTLPASARRIAVLGQVRDEVAVADPSAQSALYTDVLTSVSFSSKKWTHDEPEVSDVKYAASAPLTPQAVADIFARAADPAAEPKPFPSLVQAQQYTFWDVDESASVASPTVIGHLLSRESTSNVYVSESYDNLVQGGVVRTDIRSSKKSIEAPYAVEEADVVAVGDEKLLKDVDILRSVKEGGKLVLRAPKWKEEGDLEKRVPLFVRKAIADKRVELFILDPSQSAVFEENPVAAKSLFEFAFLRVARSDISAEQAARVVLGAASPSLEQIKEALETTLKQVSVSAEAAEVPADYAWPELRTTVKANSFAPFEKTETEEESRLSDWQAAAKGLAFKEAYGTETTLRPDLSVRTHTITVKENRRLTPETYDRNIFHIEFDLGDSGVTYKIGEALGIHAENDEEEVRAFIEWYGLDADEVVQVPSREDPEVLDTRTVFQALKQNVDVLGKPAKRFYEALSAFATDEDQRKKLATLAAPEGTVELKKRTDVDTLTYVDVLQEFSSARPSFHDLVRIVAPLKRREYSIASAQAVTPNAVALMIVVVDWVDPRGRKRWGHASRYLSQLAVGSRVTVSVKPSVMKLPASPKAPLIMAGLGTGLAPFRAFVQYRAMQKAQGEDIGAILLYLGSRHQREEYLYGEEWEAYVAAGVITHIGAAFSRDQPEKIYIQDRMRESQKAIAKAYVEEEGSFYLCGPTWPVPDVTDAIKGAIEYEAKRTGKKVNAKRQIEENKEAGRFVLEVY